MTSKLKCPFCGETMEECKGELHDFYGCHKTSCFEKYGWFSASVLQALIQAKKDLAAARAEIAFNKERCVFWDEIKTNTIQVYEEHYSSAINAIKNICNIAEDVEAYYGGVSVNYRKMVEDIKNSAQTVLKQLNQDHKE